MASIQYRRKKAYLVYDGPKKEVLVDGEIVYKRNPIWDPIPDGKDPKVILAEHKLKEAKNKVVVGSKETLSEFVPKWVEHYAPENWSFSTCQSSLGVINLHITGEIGHMRLKDIKPIDIQSLMTRLRKKPISRGNNRFKDIPDDELPRLSSTTCRVVYDILMKIFDTAVEWECIAENPVKCKRPEKLKTKRDAWSGKQTLLALRNMEDDDFLHLAVHTAFACSLRNGEAMGITLDSVNLDDNYIVIDKTIQRVSLEALEKVPRDELIYIFPKKDEDVKTALILTSPKTDRSERIVYMTAPLRAEIVKRMEKIEKNKAFYGNEYAKYDHEMLFALDNGTPIEPHLCTKRFGKWQKRKGVDLGLIRIDFHGIRHSSITYKVKLSGGDLTTVKGDSGHATVEMVGSYADHIFDEDRIKLTGHMENAFYQDEDDSRDWNEKKFDSLIEQIQYLVKQNPELLKRVPQELIALVA